ncbi:MAG TPA: hypothetical protein VJ547_00125 [Candidatus Thermoplasmatota archaeon]|nr:hypothetical protein [Candidatus Thermoplasmatota archaeon]
MTERLKHPDPFRKTYGYDLAIPVDRPIDEMRVGGDWKKKLPPLPIEGHLDCFDDFRATIGDGLKLKATQWRMYGAPLSKFVPMEYLQDLYDPSLLYFANKAELIPDAFRGNVGERLLLRCLAGLPELLVSWRFLVGFWDENESFTVTAGRGKPATIGRQDVHPRLFALTERHVLKTLVRKAGKGPIVAHGRFDLVVADENGNSNGVLSIRPMLKRILGKRIGPVGRFLEEAYNLIRLPEYHTGRMSDTIIFELDDFYAGLVESTNYLFSADHRLPFVRKERGPYSLRFLRVAGSILRPDGRMVHHSQTIGAEPTIAANYYGKPGEDE